MRMLTRGAAAASAGDDDDDASWYGGGDAGAAASSSRDVDGLLLPRSTDDMLTYSTRIRARLFRTELVAMCRMAGLDVSGTKVDLSLRYATYRFVSSSGQTPQPNSGLASSELQPAASAAATSAAHVLPAAVLAASATTHAATVLVPVDVASSTGTSPQLEAPPAGQPPSAASTSAAREARAAELLGKTVAALVAMCKSSSIAGYSGKNKAALVELILNRTLGGGAASTTPGSTRRRRSPVVLYKGAPSGTFVHLDLSSTDARLISAERASTMHFPGTGAAAMMWVEFCDRKFMQLTRQTGGHLPIDVAAFQYLSSAKAARLLEVARARGETLSGRELSLAFSGLVRTLSSSRSADFVYDEEPCDMTFQRFHSIVHHTKPFAAGFGSSSESSTTWAATGPSLVEQSWDGLRQAHRAVRSGPPSDRGGYDDDFIPFSGGFGQHASLTVIEGNGGQTLDSFVDGYIGMSRETIVRQGGSGVFDHEIDTLTNDVRAMAADRYYSKPDAVAAMHGRGIEYLGTAQMGLTNSRAFNVLDLGSRPRKLSNIDDLVTQHDTPGTILSYAGVGHQIRVGIRNDNKVVSLVIVVRRQQKEVGALHFLATGPHGADADGLDAQKREMADRAKTFVLVPGSVPRTTPPLLNRVAVASSELEPGARSMRDKVALSCHNQLMSAGCTYESEIQGDPSWGRLRFLAATGSNAEKVVLPALREKGVYVLVETALRQGDAAAEAEPVTEDSGDDESVADEPDARVQAAPGDAASGDVVHVESPPALEVELVQAAAVTSSGEIIQDSEGDAQLPSDPATSSAPSPTAPAIHPAPHAAAQPLPQATDPAPASLSPGTNLLAKVVDCTLLSGFSGNRYTRDGLAYEQRAAELVRKLDWVVGGEIFSCGMLALQGDLDHVKVSPDGFGCIYKRDAGGQFTEEFEPVVFEFKLSTEFGSGGGAALVPKFVDVGTREYYDNVPRRFRSQGLHLYSLTGMNVVFVMMSPTGPASIVVVHYAPTYGQEYLQLMRHVDLVAALRWFHNAKLDANVSDADLISRIPTDLPPLYRHVIASHLPLARAVARYVFETHAPAPPTDVLRLFFVDQYDKLKGCIDLMSRQIIDAAPGRSVTFGIVQKIMWRYFYYDALDAYRLVGLYRFMQELLRNVPSGPARANKLAALTQRQLRAGMRRAVGLKFPDFIFILARNLVASGVSLGMAVYEARAAPTATPAVVLEALGADSAVLLRYVKQRARTSNRAVSAVDYFIGTHLLVADAVLSPSTPGHVVLSSDYYADRAAAMERAALALPGASQRRKTRVELWEKASYVALRLCPILLHLSVEVDQEGRTCVWCARRVRTKACFTCALCGEVFCKSECIADFHRSPLFPKPGNDEDVEPATSSGATVPVAAPAAAQGALAGSGAPPGSTTELSTAAHVPVLATGAAVVPAVAQASIPFNLGQISPVVSGRGARTATGRGGEGAAKRGRS